MIRRIADPLLTAAWQTFETATTTTGYRAHLAAHGIDPQAPGDWTALPYTDKATCFAGDVQEWMTMPLGAMVELISSSGTSGAVSFGCVGEEEASAAADTVDAALAMLVGDSEPILVVNTLAMGVGLPSRRATVATPSTHAEMARTFIGTHGPRFAAVVVVGDPIFLTHLVHTLRAAPADLARVRLHLVVGGDWVAESWSRWVADRLGTSLAQIAVSFGAAEVGLHMFATSPPLLAARSRLRDPALAARVGTDPDDPPLLVHWDPRRLLVEERAHPDDTTTLVCTTLTPRPLPLVRYDLADAGRHLTPAEAELLGLDGLPPALVVTGRRPVDPTLPRPEWCRALLFDDPVLADRVSGRLRLGRDGETCTLDVQCRPGAPTDGAARLSERLAAAGWKARVRLLAGDDYPHHAFLDFAHKPRPVA